MNVRDLMELLEDMDPDLEVMIAQQPSWPLASKVRHVVAATDLPHDDADAVDLPSSDPRGREDILWIAAGDATEYAPGAVFDEV